VLRHFPRLTDVFLIIILLIHPASEVWAEHESFKNIPEILNEISKLGSSTEMSLAPILAYDPTFGTIYGGAVFLEKPFATRYRFNGRLAFSTRGEYSAMVALERYFGPKNYFHLEVELDDFARPYYGEGMKTDPDKRIFLKGTVPRAMFFVKFIESWKISMGPFLDFRGAEKKGVEGNDITPPEYNENTLALGMNLFYDDRDSRLDPTSGVFDTLIIRYVPKALSEYKGGNSFFQAEVDHRIFYSPADGTVLAGRLHLAKSWGVPSYQYRFSLGGPYDLRGFYVNRFRGDRLWSAQAECRQDLFWIFSGAVFAEEGEVTDNHFGSPETSYGAGIRMTLPPDNIAKVRLDFAWARDQHSIYFIFGEAF